MVKKLFMCVNYPIYNGAIGISKKIRTQIDTFQEMGFDVTYSAYTAEGVAIFNGTKLIVEKKAKFKRAEEFLRRFRLLSLCEKYLSIESFDLGFVRWDAADVQFLRVLNLMKKNCGHVIMDFHGYFPGYNTGGIKGKYTKFMTKINGCHFSKYVDIGLTETKNDSLFGVKTMPIDTGIDVSKYEPHQYSGDDNVLNMISVANETSYHGYDRIIRGMKEYFEIAPEMNVYLHLVGNISESTKTLIKECGLERYVILYGYQKGKELEKIYTNANVGVGPLAPHRIGGKEGTGMKTKEYFAIGLPYFYAGQELLVPDDYKYIHKIADDELPVPIEEIKDFIDKIRDNLSMQNDMRAFAEVNFSWKKMFTDALQLMEEK